MPRFKPALIVLVVLLARTTVVADPQHIETSEVRQHIETSEVRLLCVPPAPASECIELRPGHFVDATTWGTLDVALKTVQDQVARLTAENTSLRATATSWAPGWKTLAGAMVTGLTLGLYLDHKL